MVLLVFIKEGGGARYVFILYNEKIKLFYFKYHYILVVLFIIGCLHNLFTGGFDFILISILPFLFNYIIFITFFIDGKNKYYLKPLSLITSLYIFLLSVFSLLFFDFNKGFQFFTYYYYQNGYVLPTSAVDGVSILLIVLTTFTIPLVILCS